MMIGLPSVSSRSRVVVVPDRPRAGCDVHRVFGVTALLLRVAQGTCSSAACCLVATGSEESGRVDGLVGRAPEAEDSIGFLSDIYIRRRGLG